MALRKVKLDLLGLEEAAKSAGMHRAINAAAEDIAEKVRSQGIRVGDKDGGPRETDLPVKVYDDDTTADMKVNRARAAVSLAHPSGKAVQAKHGALTKAAAQAGYKVRGR